MSKLVQIVFSTSLFVLFSSLSLAAMPMPATQVESEFDFLAGMVPHHQDALESAELALRRAERPEVGELAQEIIAAQEAEIARMEAWLAAWYPVGDRQRVEADMNKMTASMGMGVGGLQGLSGAAFDRAFLEEMVMHHQMAVEMVDSLLERDLVEHDEVRTLARNIRQAQNAEIAEMRGWLEGWFGRAAPGAEHGGH